MADKIARFQLRELQILLKSRHGGPLPDEIDDADLDFGGAYLSVTARLCPLYLTPKLQEWLTRWAVRWAPGWANQISAIVHAVEAHPHRLTGDAIAAKLCVGIEERDRLRLRNIGAVDMTRADRKRRAKRLKKLRDRKRAAERRRDKGAKTRAEYLAASSISRAKPWLAAGISRAKWYRSRETQAAA